MQEVIEMLTENPEQTTVLAGAASTATVIYKNDFGVRGETSNDIETYLEETEGSLNPLTQYKRQVYQREKERRKEQNEYLDF